MGSHLPRHDITGQRFERWIVLRKGPGKYRTEWAYWCRCDCGIEKYVRGAALRKGDSKSCGCLAHELKRGDRYVGQRFGQLFVTERTEEKKYRKWLYRCVCDCGTEKLIVISQLTSAKTQSCGCLRGGRLPTGEAGFNYLLHEYRGGAKGRGYDFTLTSEQFRVLTQQECRYCGAPPLKETRNQRAKTGHSIYLYNGIDRVDNTQGYTPENCVTCCHRCNVAKGTLVHDDFIAMARAIAARHPE